MLCKSVLDALERYSKGHLNFINVNTTFCTSSKTFHWFNTTELVPIRQVEVIHEVTIVTFFAHFKYKAEYLFCVAEAAKTLGTAHQAKHVVQTSQKLLTIALYSYGISI